MAVDRDGDAVVEQQRVDQPVDEQRDRVHSAHAAVHRVATGPERAGVGARPLAGEDDAFVHHRDHERVEVIHVLCGQAELAAHVIEDAHEGVPLGLRDVEVLVCLIHWTARVGLRAAGEGADDLHDEELEAGPLRRRVPPGDHWVGVEKIVCHPRIHATVDEARDAEHAAAARVERARLAVDAESVGHVLTTGSR